MSKIKSIKAREVLDSRGIPTVEADLKTEQGIFSAQVPSGTSEGKYEAIELRDGGRRFFGEGVLKAVKNIEEIINSKLKGEDVSNQKKIDEILIELDGTKNKSHLGANALLGVSIACCRAGAGAKMIPLYQYIAEIFNFPAFAPPAGGASVGRQFSIFKAPKPCFNVLNGGAHAGSNLDIQEFMIVPQFERFEESLRTGVEIYHCLKEILKEKFGVLATNVGQEGGFVPPVSETKNAIDLIMKAIEKSGYSRKTMIGLDCAASQFFKDGKYNFEGKNRKREELSDFYQDLVKEYPILFLEDPFSQDDWEGWNKINSKLKIKNEKLLIVGDDLTVTNPKRTQQAHKKEACNGIILKPDQIGTVSEALQVAKLAKSFGWKIIVSHRSGDTCDDFIADFAVGIGADFIKAGAPSRGERVAKYNRLLRIEEELKE